jgi:leucyl-tRNA synthetase
MQDISIDVFTTRPDTIYGCTYLVMAPEHKLLSSITTTSRFEELSAFSLEILKSGAIERSNTSKSKRGMPTGGTELSGIDSSFTSY